ncbi:ketopantoate reductase family protein [Clostridium sp. Cult1]|uniref:ketopantoate reductase family protein n=1 Tax=Clostridium sp. Cult1 TaxID=2079002 RepID=UPI001F3AFDC5|nr:2-dehydropantoate 2-reductase [Clostridium sp. Cult1]MCF6463148.1 2-dehydropantoate 2-reductase [Clostridium sp. Cult1]
MRIAIIGSGAMGSLYGGYLSKGDNEVYLVDIWEEHINRINDKGLIIVEDNIELMTKPRGITDSKGIGPVDLVIVFVKSTHTKNAIENNLSIIGPRTMVLSLQNGYGNADGIGQYVPENNIILGTTSHGATMIQPGKIRHAGKGKTYIGKLIGINDENVTIIRNVLNEAGFETIISDNVMELVWSKLLVNVGINALTAILEIRNGKLLKWEESKELLTLAVSEGVKVANGLGLDFSKEEVISSVINVAKTTGENKSSMLQDILNGRKTEIEKINGAIVKEGEKLGLDTPVNRVLMDMIKVKEKLARDV